MMFMKTKQPRKQRKRLYNLPLHRRGRIVSARFDKKLRVQYKKRNFPLRKGDKVKILKGEHKKKEGKILRINLKSYKIFIDGVKMVKPDGKEIQLPISPSNVEIVELDLSDPKRKEALARGFKA